jgi:hypothetical protein
MRMNVCKIHTCQDIYTCYIFLQHTCYNIKIDYKEVECDEGCGRKEGNTKIQWAQVMSNVGLSYWCVERLGSATRKSSQLISWLQLQITLLVFAENSLYTKCSKIKHKTWGKKFFCINTCFLIRAPSFLSQLLTKSAFTILCLKKSLRVIKTFYCWQQQSLQVCYCLNGLNVIIIFCTQQNNNNNNNNNSVT